MRRRDFIKVIAGSAVVWPLAARAQTQLAGARRMACLWVWQKLIHSRSNMYKYYGPHLRKLGWTDNQNVRFAYRYAAGDPGRARAYAKELVDRPVTFASGPLGAEQGASQTGSDRHDSAVSHNHGAA